MKGIRSVLVFIIIAPLLMGISFAASTNISATVNVQCPFALHLNAKPVYLALPNQSINFTLYTLSNCTIPNMNGSFIIANNSGRVYSAAIRNISADSSKKIYSFAFDANGMSEGNYSASLSFFYVNFGNSSDSSFFISKPVNISIENFSTQSSIGIDSPQQFFISLKNIGSFAAPNSIKIAIRNIGPYISYLALPSNYSLAPSQYLNITVTMYNSTLESGTYYSTLNVTYLNQSSEKYASKASKYKTIYYTVPATVIKQKAKSIPITPSFTLDAFPYMLSLPQGQSYNNFITLTNNENTTEYFNITVPSAFSNIVKILGRNIAILPHSQISVSALFEAPSNLEAGVYNIPINITSTISNKSSSETVYATLSIFNSTKQNVLPNILALGNGRNESTTLIITNPSSSNLTNVVAKTILPITLVSNASDIKTSGIPSSISVENGSYVITWYVGALPRHSSTYAYINIYNISNPTLLQRFSNILAAPSPVAPSNIVRIVNINVPTFYAGVQNNISILGLYTGAYPENISVSLTGPAKMLITNFTRTIHTTPNMVFAENFTVLLPSPGTALLNLYIVAGNQSLSYSIPALVLSKPATTTIPTTTIPPMQREVNPYVYIYSALTISILVILIVIFSVSKLHNRPKYNPERVERLRLVKESIKRSE